MYDYLKSLGGSPFISGNSWNEKAFNLAKIFYAEPDHAINLFLDHKLHKCQHPENQTAEILCFKYEISWNDTSQTALSDTVEMLIEMYRNVQGQNLYSYEIEAFTVRAAKAAAVVQEFYNLKVSYFRLKVLTKFQFNLLSQSVFEQESENLNLKLVRIKDMANLLPLPQVNWLKVVNDQLLKSSKMTSGDFILIENFGLMEKLVKLLSSAEKS